MGEGIDKVAMTLTVATAAAAAAGEFFNALEVTFLFANLSATVVVLVSLPSIYCTSDSLVAFPDFLTNNADSAPGEIVTDFRKYFLSEFVMVLVCAASSELENPATSHLLLLKYLPSNGHYKRVTFSCRIG